MIGPLNGSPNRLSYGVFPSAKRSWNFADSNNSPQNQTTIFHPILIVAILLKYLLSLVERLSQ